MIPVGAGSMTIDTGRRQFIAALCGAAVTWPLAARAQQASKVPTVGVLGADAAAWSPWTAAFADRLRQLGWVEGRTIAFEYRWSEGRRERVPEIAAEFVRQNVDVIVSYGSAISVLKQATTIIPVVFAVAVDPVGAGLVASLARPGGNVTGLSLQQMDVSGKRLELLRQVVPGFRRLAVMADAGYPDAVLEADKLQATAHALGIEVVPLEIRRAEDITPAFEALKADALYVISDALVMANRTRIITLALGARLPAIYSYRDYVQAGGLMSYGPNYSDLFRRTAEIVDKILHGTKPGDIPVEQPTKFELVVNLTTAKALGLNVPPTFLALADETIE